MLDAIGSQNYTGAAAPERSSAGLQAQLSRLQRELSDCVNCDTANTREGRDTIKNLSNRINALRARIEEIQQNNNRTGTVKPDEQPSGQLYAAHPGAHKGGIVDVFA